MQTPTSAGSNKRSISLYPRETAIVMQIAKDNGLDFSSALRYIISDWVRMKRDAIIATATPTPEPEAA